jgi:hypothetical protein
MSAEVDPGSKKHIDFDHNSDQADEEQKFKLFP